MSAGAQDGHGYSPLTLNELSDDVLHQHVVNVLEYLRDSENHPLPSKVASFMTAGVLLRLHNTVVAERNACNGPAGWTKQATLACVVGFFTGIRIKRADAEYIGNAQDYFLKDFSRSLGKAIRAEKEARSRARRAGRAELPTDSIQSQRIRELEMKIYRCRYGGVPRNTLFGDAGSSRQPLLKQPVPVQKVPDDAAEVNLKLLHEIQELKKVRPPLRDMQSNLGLLCGAIEMERQARKLAEHAAAKAEASQVEAETKAAARVVELKRRVRAAELECSDSNAQIIRLGGLLGAAHVEAARMLEREAKYRHEAEVAAAEAASSHREEEAKFAARLKELRQKVRDAEAQCCDAKAQVVRLGGQLGRAHVEAARALEREAIVRQEAEQAALEAADAQVNAVAQCMQQLQALKSEARQKDSERRQQEGRLQRLGCQLGAALIEAARATESAREAQTTVEALEERLHAQEEAAAAEISHVRRLKASMAKRARNADKRAALSDALRLELDQTRTKLRELRKEMNRTKVQLNLQVADVSEDSEEEDIEARVVDSDSDGALSEGETDEAARALEQLRSMPTWRAVREKGKRGEPKLEWGTRVTIYSLLAMMVPPSAIGMAIVAIVKRTAPWLNPSAPTYETIKRCRFELRVVEEVNHLHFFAMRQLVSLPLTFFVRTGTHNSQTCDAPSPFVHRRYQPGGLPQHIAFAR